MQPDISQVADKADSSEIKRKSEMTTRLWISIIFSSIYMLFVVSVIAFWLYDLFHPVAGRTERIKDMTLTVSGILSGPLGLIIGYYFGAESKKTK